MKLIKILGVVLAFVVAGSAQAATLNDTCGSIQYGADQQGVALSPIGCGSGNDEGKFGYGRSNGWTLIDSVGDTGGVGVNGLLTISKAALTWSLDLPFLLERVAIAFKQSSSFVFYELDMSEVLSGTWTIAGPGKSVNNFSHVNLWYIDSRFPIGTDPYDNPAPVPLPGSGMMLIAGIGGLGLGRRFRRS